MGEVVIRQMKKADLPAVGALAGQLVRLHHAWDPRRFFLQDGVEDGYAWFFGTQLRRKGAVLLVAEVDGALAGYLYGSLEPRDWAVLLDEHGVIHDVLVAPAFRRRGVARRLMEEGLGRLEALGAPRVVLHTAVQNADAHALFEALGFRRTMIEMTRESPGR